MLWGRRTKVDKDGPMEQETIITLTQTNGISFAWHAENGEIVIDKCEGISPAAGMSMFPAWAVKELLDTSRGR